VKEMIAFLLDLSEKEKLLGWGHPDKVFMANFFADL
jgi:hypothetical protein